MYYSSLFRVLFRTFYLHSLFLLRLFASSLLPFGSLSSSTSGCVPSTFGCPPSTYSCPLSSIFGCPPLHTFCSSPLPTFCYSLSEFRCPPSSNFDFSPSPTFSWPTTVTLGSLIKFALSLLNSGQKPGLSLLVASCFFHFLYD